MSDPVCERVVLQEPGWERDLQVIRGSAAPPEPASDEVAIRLEASGVCHRDLIDRDGRISFLQVPVTPGHEGVGRVVLAGPDVTEWAVGDRVATLHRDACGACAACHAGDSSLCQRAVRAFGLTVDGTYARWLLAPQTSLYAVPDALDPALAATLHCTFGTAWRGLVTVGGLRAGERVLITGANGGVGEAAVQIAARFASRVIAVVRREGHEERLRALGATDVLVSPDNRFHKEAPDADLVLECVGEPTFNASLRSLRVGGRVAVVGNVTPDRAQLNLGFVVTMGMRILGPGGANRADMAALLAEHARVPFRSIVAQELPLERADEAQRRLKAGGLRGRIVLRP